MSSAPGEPSRSAAPAASGGKAAPKPPAAGPSSDSASALLCGLRAGDEAALATLYQRYSALVHGLALRILRVPSDAEEVVVDVFVQAWTGIDRFEERRGTLCTWLLLMTRTRALDYLRKRCRRADLLAEAATLSEHPWALGPGAAGDSQAQFDCRDALEPLLGRLPEPQRQVIELAYFQGMSQSEISVALDTPLGTVKSRMRSGMAKLCTWAETPPESP